MSPPAAPTGAGARRGSGMAVVGLILLLLGGAIALLAGVRLVGGLVDALDVQSAPVPGSTTVMLEPGPYTVYALEGRSALFTPADVSVTTPDGTGVPVGAITARETLTLGQDSYRGVGGFKAQTAGLYTVTVRATAPEGRLVVSRSMMSTLTGVAGWIVALAVGAVTVLLGLGLGIAGLVRRGSRPVAPVTAAAGWYPDPNEPSGQRYWDGAAWTEHRA